MTNTVATLSPISALHLFRKNRGSGMNRNISKELSSLKTVIKKILNQFGEIYTFNDSYFIGLVEQALEVVRFNDWKDETMKKGLEIIIFQFILTSLGEDLQNLFYFYYALEFLKVTDLLPQDVWEHLISGI